MVLVEVVMSEMDVCRDDARRCGTVTSAVTTAVAVMVVLAVVVVAAVMIVLVVTMV